MRTTISTNTTNLRPAGELALSLIVRGRPYAQKEKGTSIVVVYGSTSKQHVLLGNCTS